MQTTWFEIISFYIRLYVSFNTAVTALDEDLIDQCGAAIVNQVIERCIWSLILQ